MGPPPSSRGGAPPGRRAPARGVDVKPRTRRGPGSPIGVPWPPRPLRGLPDQVRSRIRDPGNRGPRPLRGPEVSRRPQRALRPGPAAPTGVVLHQPLPGTGPGGPEKAQKPRFWGIPAKKAIFRHFGQKWLFLAIFSKKCPVATGLKTPKSPKNGRNPQNGQKVRFCGSQPPRRGGFTSTPRGGALYPVSGPAWGGVDFRTPGETRARASGRPSRTSRDPGTPGRGQSPGTARRDKSLQAAAGLERAG